MMMEHEGEYASLWRAIRSTAPKFGCYPETLWDWVRQVERDEGKRAGASTAERERIKALEHESRVQRDPAQGIDVFC